METGIVLTGEGDVKIVIKTKVRRACDNCGDRATKRLTFCYINGRSNPASSMYRRDDCTYCADSVAYACDKCERYVESSCCPDGMRWGATFPANDRNSSMFLQWIERDAGPAEAAPDLLKALESIAECCDEDHAARDYVSRQTEIRGIARLAIAQARGEATC